MAVQTIYTGKGMQAPQTRGYALQALSQFGQQKFARKTREIEQSYRDRDAFAKMLEMDPVYASSQAAQKRIAGIMDGYVDKMTMINKKRVGPMTTQDLVDMQRERGMAMAEMGYIKAANDEFVQAAKEYNASPWDYDKETWETFKDTWLNQGVRPEGSPLLPAVQDPYLYGINLLKDAGFRTEETSSFVKRDGSRELWNKSSRWDLKGQEPEDVASMLVNHPAMKWHVNRSFMKTSEDEQKEYIERANGNEFAAANMWYTENMAEKLRGRASQPFYKRPPVSNSYGGINLAFRSGELWDGKYKIFGTEENVPVADVTLDNAIVFTRPQSKKNPMPVPVRLLELPEGVEARGNDVDAIVHVADQDKTYFIVDSRSFDKISFTKKAMEAYPKGVFTEDPDKPGYFKIKDDVDEDIVLPASTSGVKSLVDSWTGGKFSEALMMLPDKAESKGGTIDLMGL